MGGGSPADVSAAMSYMVDEGVCEPEPGPPMPANQDWNVVKNSAGDHAKQDALGYGWIGSLPAHLRESIDTNYGVDKTAAAARKSQEVKKSKANHGKILSRYERSPFLHGALGDTFHESEDEQVKKLAEGERSPGTPDDSLTTPDTPTVTADQGRMRARNDFMEWGRGLLGTDDKVREHFEGVRQIQNGQDMYLAAGAADRFDNARQQFHAEHPEQYIPLSGSSTELRGRHEKNEGVGMEGHPLGFSFDLDAVHNPDIRSKDGFTMSLLSKFGADPSVPGSRGRVLMDTDMDDRHENGTIQSRVERLGMHTQSGAVDAKDRATEGKIRREFDELARTSENFQHALPEENKAVLAKARELYFDYLKAEQRLKAHPNDQAAQDAVADASAYRGLMDDALGPWKEQMQQEDAAARMSGDKKTQSENAGLEKGLSDPAKIFGSEPGATARLPGVSQLLTDGFIRNDAPEHVGATFNADTAVALARQGFAPGASYGDMMHFDYIQGFSEEVAGGWKSPKIHNAHGAHDRPEKAVK